MSHRTHDGPGSVLQAWRAERGRGLDAMAVSGRAGPTRASCCSLLLLNRHSTRGLRGSVEQPASCTPDRVSALSGREPRRAGLGQSRHFRSVAHAARDRTPRPILLNRRSTRGLRGGVEQPASCTPDRISALSGRESCRAGLGQSRHFPNVAHAARDRTAQAILLNECVRVEL